MHTDPISDMLTRIRNAAAVKKNEVVLPYSKLKFEVARVLKNNHFVASVEKISANRAKDNEPGNFDQLRIVLKYDDQKESVIKCLKRISKPGRRIYVTKDNLPYVLDNLGLAIISTPRGLMTNKEARKAGSGGEIICEVY